MHYVLIGGGLASATAAEHIRTRDADGEITLIGAEPHLPYNRPPLSKEYLRGDAEVNDTFIHPEDRGNVTLLYSARYRSTTPPWRSRSTWRSNGGS